VIIYNILLIIIYKVNISKKRYFFIINLCCEINLIFLDSRFEFLKTIFQILNSKFFILRKSGKFFE
jgi:hypothetical protein